MARGDIDRLHAVSGTKDKPDLLAVEEERNASAFSQGQALVVSAEPALGATDSGYSKTQSEMCGKSQPSGMRDPLPVTQQDIGFLSYFPVCFDKRRDLPKREQSRHIGESSLADMMDGLNRFKAGPLE